MNNAWCFSFSMGSTVYLWHLHSSAAGTMHVFLKGEIHCCVHMVSFSLLTVFLLLNVCMSTNVIDVEAQRTGEKGNERGEILIHNIEWGAALSDPHYSIMYNPHSITFGFGNISMRAGSIRTPRLCPLYNNCLFWLTEPVYLPLITLNTISPRSGVCWEKPVQSISQ